MTGSDSGGDGRDAGRDDRDSDDLGREAVESVETDPENTKSDHADRSDPEVVVAQGTFDLIHPGHIHYLREAAAMGDRLVAIVAREPNVTHKPDPICPAEQRREVVAAFEPVDRAILGDREDIFAPIERLDPAIIALGFDQHHEESAIESALADRGLAVTVRRASPREASSSAELLSTGAIVDRILDERGR